MKDSQPCHRRCYKFGRASARAASASATAATGADGNPRPTNQGTLSPFTVPGFLRWMVMVLVMIQPRLLESFSFVPASRRANKIVPSSRAATRWPFLSKPTRAATSERKQQRLVSLSLSSSLTDRNSFNSSSSSVLEDDEAPESVGTTKRKDDDGRSQTIINTVTEYFTSSSSSSLDSGKDPKRGNLQLVAGSGKTFIAWNVMENLLSRVDHDETDPTGSTTPRIGVYVTPFLNLVSQALQNRDEHGLLQTEDPRQRSIDTMILASKSDRKTERCSTKVEDILDFLAINEDGFEKGISNWKIFVTTYNSMPKLGEALRQWDAERANEIGDVMATTTTSVDFAVFDEAHKMEGLGGSDTGFAYGLYDSNIVIQNRLFMSGTPNNYTQDAKIIEVLPTRPRADGARLFIPKRNTTDVEETVASKGVDRKRGNIRSFSDEALFGPCLARKSHRESVAENVTLPISLYGVEIDVFRDHYGPDDLGMIGDGMEKDFLLPLAIRSAFHKLGIKHAVTFHSTNQRARDFLELFESVNSNGESHEPIALFNVNHTMSPDEQRRMLDAAKESPRSLVSNCRLLSTGVDEASWDLVVIADPVMSSVLGKQMIGRVGRKAPEKERGYVLVPIPSYEQGEIDTEGLVYQVFVNTFNHMVQLDSELQRDVLFVVRTSSELGRPLLPSEFPQRLSEAFLLPTTMPLDFQNQLMNSAIREYNNRESLASKWNQMFELLAVYKQREGNSNVPSRYQEDGLNLGTWLNRQRQDKKNGKLDKDLEERLNQLGVVWDVIAQQWEDMYALLVQYEAREGNSNVPHNHQEDGLNLGIWLRKQRTLKKKGKLDKVLEERLNQLGVVWDPLAQQWEDTYALLVQYEAREGNSNVPSTYQEDGLNLGTWLNTQRQEKKKGKLDKDLEERLNQLGVVWDVTAQQWEDMYALLVKYEAREGNSNVPSTHQEDGLNLGSWLDRQRQNKKNGKLDKNLEERLNQLDVVWDVTAQQWEDMYALLVQYEAREGNSNVPSRYQEDGLNLGIWLTKQRQEKKNGKLDKDLEERLNQLGIVWDQHAQQWEDMYALLVQYEAREGNSNVPQNHQEDGLNLGTWLKKQRQNKKNGKLDKDLEERLNQLGVVWDVIAQQWEDMYALLVQYEAREGNSNVPQNHQEDGLNLGIWLQTQRRTKKNGKLDKDLEERLNQLGIVWDPFAQQWEDMYALLVQYEAREGNSNVPSRYQEDGLNLGSWLDRQRQNKKNGKLDKNLEERLNQLGVVWDVIAQQWEDMYALLVQYEAREGNSNVPQNHQEDGLYLGAWLTKQRQEKKNGKLDKDLEERLNQLGIVWDPFAQQWEDMYALLVQYEAREGNCNVPYKHNTDGLNLGGWLSKQRTLKKNGKLDKELEERLNQLGIVWDPLAQQWEDMYALLVKYEAREGKSNVPSRYQEDGLNLGNWLSRQRTLKKKGKLDKDLEERLNQLGVVWDVPAQQWEDMYALLVQYEAREGNSNVPSTYQEDGLNLGGWLSKQRTLKKNGKLDKDLEERLDQLGIVWSPRAQKRRG